MKNFIKNFYPLLGVYLLYIIGYFFAYPHIPKAFVYQYHIGDTLIDLFEKTMVFLVFFLITAIVYKNQYTRVLSYIISLTLVINFTLSIYFRTALNQDFDTGLALSILGTNSSEAVSILKDFKIYLYILISVFYFVLILKSLKIISQYSFNKKIYIALSGSVLLILLYNSNGYQSIYYGQNIKKFRPEKQKHFSNLYPIYYLNEFIIANGFLQDLKKINTQKVDYNNLKIEENGIDTIVLVIGESARKDNMSLYGYNRPTTPFEDQEKKNMLLYNHAVSPGPLTLISIPMILSKAMPDDYSYSSPKFSDNILSLAQHLNYDTYWLSTQKFPGQDVSLISVFENYAQNVKRIDGVYDEKILPYLDTVLNNPKKKLIVLHINGSHMTYCDKYPSSEAYFTGAPNNIDCYDNSIRYTDKVLGQIFNKLKGSNSCLVYVSDHATTLDHDKMLFSNTKDQTKVPMYIWYSPKLLSNKPFKTGQVETQTQTTIIYPLIANLLGVKNTEIYNKKYTENLRFVNSDLSVINYKDLKEKN